MKIEAVSIEDSDSLKKLARIAINESVEAGIDLKREIVSDTEIHIDKNVARSDRVFLKCTDTAIMGFILVQKFWNLSDLFVLPSVQGRGIGKQLLDEAKATCMAEGTNFIRVNSSLNAEGFYRSQEFTTYAPENEVPAFVVPLVFNFRFPEMPRIPL